MSNALSARTQALLEAARHEASPGPETLGRVRAKLAERLPTEAAVTVAPALLTKVLAVLGLLAAGGVVGVTLERWSRAPVKPLVLVAPSSSGGPSSVAPAVAACPEVPACPAAPVCPPVAPARPVCPPVGSATSDEAQAARAKGKTESVYSAPLLDADRSALEVGLLMDARVAVDEGQGVGALGHLERHERLFPETNFLEERLALRVLAACLLERRAEALPFWKALLERAPQTSYGPRIRQQCGSLDE